MESAEKLIQFYNNATRNGTKMNKKQLIEATKLIIQEYRDYKSTYFIDVNDFQYVNAVISTLEGLLYFCEEVDD